MWMAAGRSLAADGPARVTGLGAAHDAFDRYERRFAEARLQMPVRNPASADDRAAIVRTTCRCLGIRDPWRPTVQAEVVRRANFEGGRIEMLRASSWPGVVATALLYHPAQPAGEPAPLVVLCCGHGAGGKLDAGYQRMARHLARRGAMVLCPDNIGQGERVPMGHGDCVAPFACGTSVQGLIVVETLAWVAWAGRRPGVDPRRLAAVGNSGGGTLTVFLAALCPELAAVSSSGYPSTFEFIAQKEKKHCHCNILPGIVGQLEMWHLLGCFAPRPMFLFQGASDALIPQDLFLHLARNVRDVYRSLGAEANLRAALFPGEHPWDARRNVATGDFLAQHLGLHPAVPGDAPDEALLSADDRCLTAWPATALDADRLAQQLTGRRVGANLKLWDVFPPQASSQALQQDLTPRGSTRQILAQFEAFLQPPR
jgi:dienelactone hydrolase